MIPFQLDDGGRADAAFKGEAGDCVTRAVAIASGRPYREVYDALSEIQSTLRNTKRRSKSRSARTGVSTKRKAFRDYMASLGFTWRATMGIGTGCTVHLKRGEIPATGRHVVMLSRHACALVDGVVRDAYDPSRGGTRCVYGLWSLDR